MTKSIHSKAHKEICSLLVQAREEAGLRQVDVADKIGIQQAELSKIENGQRRVEFITLIKLSDLYQKPINYFIPNSLKENDKA